MAGERRCCPVKGACAVLPAIWAGSVASYVGFWARFLVGLEESGACRRLGLQLGSRLLWPPVPDNPAGGAPQLLDRGSCHQSERLRVPMPDCQREKDLQQAPAANVRVTCAANLQVRVSVLLI